MANSLADPVWPQPPIRLSGRAVRGEEQEVEGVSVVIPCLNAAGTLDRALASLISQTYVGWRAVLVDDGSQDGSAACAARWAARDPRISIVRQGHAGASAARNRGLALATRTWLCFLDADDWLAPRAFERLLDLARRSPQAAVVMGRSLRVTPDGRAWPLPARDLADAFGVLCSDCPMSIHSALVRRCAVLSVGSFDRRLKTSEDWDLWQRVARAGFAFAQTEEVVAYYRTRTRSLSRNVEQAAADALEVMRRGHSPDARVAGGPQAYAQGAPADALPARQLYYVLWAAARGIAAGGDGLAIAALLPSPVDVDFEPDAIGELMAAGAADMLATAPSRTARAWAEMAPKFRRLFEWIYPEPARRRLIALAMAAIEANLNGGGAEQADVLQLDAADRPLAVDQACDFAVLQLREGGRTLGSVGLPMLSRRSGANLAKAIAGQIEGLPLRRALLAARPWRTGMFWLAAGRALLRPRGLGLLAQRRRCRDRFSRFLRQRVRHALRCGLQAVVAARLAPPARRAGPCAHSLELARLRQETAELPSPMVGPPQAASSAASAWPGPRAGPEAWDRFFEAPEPWNQAASAYERMKFDDTLELVPELPTGSALELACAEGHFTQRLAAKVGRLLATDISPRALARARARCEGAPNVAFQTLDFIRSPIPGSFDLIVCSEALYYSGRSLGRVARKIAASLKPGGWLVMAHSSMVADEPDASGFDWGHKQGSHTIGEVFQRRVGLHLEREIRRPLYRVQAFRRGAKPAAEALRETRPLEAPLEPSVARQVVWGGGVSRLTCFRTEAAVTIPILMYHRVSSHPIAGLARYCVAPARFEEQIAYLRRNGYWGVTPEDLLHALEDNVPLPGRPVMLTFDDGYADFVEHAWPVLKRHDFTATVFVVADAVGGRAEWDAARGPPAALMDWPTLAALSAAGVRVENHGASHRPLTRLGVREAYRDVLRGAALIEKATGRTPLAFCYPYGAHDRVVECVARESGALLGFTAISGAARLASPPLRLPRVEISGFDDLQSFARKLGPDAA